MKKLSDTQWACRIDAILAVYENYTAILTALDEIHQMVMSCHVMSCHVSSEACSQA